LVIPPEAGIDGDVGVEQIGFAKQRFDHKQPGERC
jgi:hypothetical protein